MEKRRQKDKKTSNIQILFLITFAGIMAGIYRNGIMTLFPFLQSEFSLTRTQVGLYSTFLYTSSTIVAILSGRIADYWGVKKSMIMGLVFMGLFIIFHAFASGFIIILIFATLTGLGLSMILPTSSKGIADNFGSDNQSTVMGIMTLGFPLGGVIGAVLIPWIGKNLGWRIDVIIMGSLFFMVAILFKILYFDGHEDKKNKIKDDQKDNTITEDIILLFNNKYLIVLCILGFYFGVASGIVVTHFTLFLYMDYGFKEVMAGVGFMFLQMGSVIGRPAWGLLNDRVFNNIKRNGFLYLGISASIVFIIFGFMNNFNSSLLIIFICAFLLGATGRGWQGLYFSAVSDQLDEGKTGIGIGLSLVFVRIGIIIGPPIFGYIADRSGSYSYSWILLSIVTFITIITIYFTLGKFKDQVS